jgi:D-alanine-D-alanine ligase
LKILKEKKGFHLLSEKIILPDPRFQALIALDSKKKILKLLKSTKIDVVFPVLHGPYGEDGTIQGLLELANIPYVGAGVLASAIGMDKIIQKKLFKEAGLPVVKFLYFTQKEWSKNKNKIIKEISQKLGFPCFTKPANLGSSVGISKIHFKKELEKGVNRALKYDRKIIVEKAVKKAREIEISVLGNEQPQVSLPGEIIPSREFYDYQAKYIDNASQLIIPAPLPYRLVQKIKKLALKAYQSIDCSGMARVDFLLEGQTNKIYLNEINTIPGFTAISMYPKLWAASGLSYSRLIETLIKLALQRHKNKSKLATSYSLKKQWYK